MKLNTSIAVGDVMVCSPKCGPMGGMSFNVTVTDILPDGTFIVEDEDSDFFGVSAEELTQAGD